MKNPSFFPRTATFRPTIYAYQIPDSKNHNGLLKIGYTADDVRTRILQQTQTAGIEFKIVLEEAAVRNDGTIFYDRQVHKYLEKKGLERVRGEWFKCSLKDITAALLEIKSGIQNEDGRTVSFGLRPEQQRAIEKTVSYFNSYKKDNPKKSPHFLWNAKMRFGKTFAAYQLAKKMGWKKILVLTFKPAVQSAWEEDLVNHVDFKGWQFISRTGKKFSELKRNQPIVCFGSFQDYLGKNESGGIKSRNEWVHATSWDVIIFDEYHYGAWRENAKDLFDRDLEADEEELRYNKLLKEGLPPDHSIHNLEQLMPITASHYLYLSGTPFRAIGSGEFIEEQIFNWTYSDEQKAKIEWKGDNNPYAALPRMVMMTYKLPDNIRDIALGGEFNEFDLNIFFSAQGSGNECRFVFENEVQKWLDLIRGSFTETNLDNLKLGAKKPPLPFSHAPLLRILTHTLWFLPTVNSCRAMKNLLSQRQNKFYHDYHVIVAAGSEAGMGMSALGPVKKAMGNPLETKTITLSCGKLTTGVTVNPWTGIFMLRNSSSPETYFQAAFRVQSPWTILNPDNRNPNKEDIIKHECYVFDFAPNRALRQLAEYSCKLNVNESTAEDKVAEFINFLPVLAYDGSSMSQINAAEVLDMASSGTTATLLARRWESALLVNVDNQTLQRLLNSKKAMEVLMSIEGFRSLNTDITTIINKSDAVLRAKKELNGRELSDQQKRELTKDEKEYKTKRKQIQDKLIKFATRIPVFMYLTDYRERSLTDVITQLEPGLFKKVTGLNMDDFELLVSLGLFNEALMNDAVFKFKRYEDASLAYAGINMHEGQNVGGYSTVLSSTEFRNIFVNEP